MDHRFNRIIKIVCVVSWALMPTLAARAQNTTSVAITGTVTDPSSALVPGAKVTVTNQATGLSHTSTTGGNGIYNEESLPPGDYSVTVSMTGFKTEILHNVHLDPGQRRGVDLKLEVGDEGVSVTVEADALTVQTESAETGGTITSQEVQGLMVNGRNFSQLTSVLPGVSNTQGANGNYQAGQGAITSTVIVNGSSDEETMYTIDGVYNVTSASNITLPITPVIDQISEMRVLEDNYSARYGLGGRQILVTTMSGGKNYHGSVYGYERSNEYGTAKPYLDTPSQTLPSLHLTDWGLTLGGPVKIPRVFNSDGHRGLFFFVGADWKANHQSSTLNSRNTFTSAIRAGNLSSEPALPTGAVLTPYSGLDAAHQAILAARYPANPAACIFQETGSGNYNAILPACMDPNTVALMNAYWPLPNYTGTYNYINTLPTKFSVNDQLYRGDWNLNDKNTIILRILHEETASINASRNYNDPSPNPGSAAYTPALDALLRWQVNINQNLINTASLAEIYTKYYSNLSGTYTVPSSVNIAQRFPGADPLNRIPDISLNNDTHSAENWFWLGVGALPTYSKDGTGEFSDDVTWIRHAHTFQFGMEYMWNLLRANAASAFPMGNFCINGDYSGDTAGDYLLGFLANANNGCSFGYEQTNAQRAGVFHEHWTEAYFQDDWKVSPRLTLNLGLRWSYYGAPTMDGNNVSNFVPSSFASAQAPVPCPYSNGTGCSLTASGTAQATWEYLNSQNQPLTSLANGNTVANLSNNGLLTACQGTPCGFTLSKKGLFAPRIGFAYRLTNDGKTSMHGGFGMGYTQVGLLQTSNLLSNIPFVQQPTYNSTEFSTPTGSTTTGSAVPNAPGLTALNATAPGYQPASIRNYSLTVERQVTPGGVVSAGYAGMVTQHIFTSALDQNFPQNNVPGAASGTYISATGSAACAAASPVAGQPTSGFAYDPCINAGSVNSAFYRPYQGYAGITTGVSIGVANYNGLLIGYVQRIRDLTAHVSYTFSKSLGDINASGVQVAYSSSGSFQNTYNPLGDYGKPDYDRPNVFVYSLVYDVPAFRNASSHLEKTLLGGFRVSSFMTDESGFAQTPTFASGLASRPNANGPIIRNHGTDGKPGQRLPVYNYGNWSRPSYGNFGTATVGSIRAPKEVSIHLAVEKGFAIAEGFSAKLGAQAFNILNHPNVLGLNTAWSPTSQGSFGTASSYGDPRQMQFYAKISF